MTKSPYPEINHIDEVLPHVEGRDDFIVGRREGFTYIDYLFVQSDTFDHPIRRECRGLKFGPDGQVLARPFHKFFNLGERPESAADKLDFTAPHVITEKLDGSMVHPALLNGELVMMTRAGISDQAKQAMAWLDKHPKIKDRIVEFLRSFRFLGGASTPIFEWTSPENRIVLKYQEPTLSLLATRDNTYGYYCSHEAVLVGADYFGIPAVPLFPVLGPRNAEQILNTVKPLKGKEGVVVAWEDGTRVKIKADEYVLLHRTLDETRNPRAFAHLVLDGKLDDVLALIPSEEERQELRDKAFKLQFKVTCAKVFLRDIKYITAPLYQRKSFAEKVKTTVPAWLQGACFKVYDGADLHDAATQAVRNKIKTLADAEELMK